MLNNEKTITWYDLDKMHEDLWLDVRATLEGLYALTDMLHGKVVYVMEDGNVEPWVAQSIFGIAQSIFGIAQSINNLDIMAGKGLDEIAQARLPLIKEGLEKIDRIRGGE